MIHRNISGWVSILTDPWVKCLSAKWLLTKYKTISLVLVVSSMIWGHHNKYINLISSVKILSPFGINPNKKPSSRVHPSPISLRKKLKKEAQEPSFTNKGFLFLTLDVTFLALSSVPAPVNVLDSSHTFPNACIQSMC